MKMEGGDRKNRTSQGAVRNESSLEKLQRSIKGSEASRVPPGTDRAQLTRLDRKMLEINPIGEARRRELSDRPLSARERGNVQRAIERLKKKDS